MATYKRNKLREYTYFGLQIAGVCAFIILLGVDLDQILGPL